MRPLTQSELVQALLEAGQPHALVEVHGEVTCYDEHATQSNDVPVRHKVVGVRSELNKVILEVEE